MTDKEVKQHIGEAGYITDEQLKEIEQRSGVSKEEIDAADKAQEIETDKFKQHVFEYQRYSDLSQVTRHLLGALTQLNKYKDKRRIDYWAGVAKHWEKQVNKVLNNKELYNPPLTKQLLDELDTNIERLRKLKPADLVDINIFADDIQYRLGAMYASLVTLEGIKQYAIEKRHSDLIEYVTNRIKLLEERQLNPTAIDTMESLTNDNAVIIELRGLIYHDTLSKNNNDERSK